MSNPFKEHLIAKNRNTFAKRQREQDKRQRADDKRLKRDRKLGVPETIDQSSMFPTLDGPPPPILPKSTDSSESGLPG